MNPFPRYSAASDSSPGLAAEPLSVCVLKKKKKGALMHRGHVRRGLNTPKHAE